MAARPAAADSTAQPDRAANRRRAKSVSPTPSRTPQLGAPALRSRSSARWSGCGPWPASSTNLVLEPHWLAVAVIVAIVFGGRLLLNLFVWKTDRPLIGGATRPAGAAAASTAPQAQ